MNLTSDSNEKNNVYLKDHKFEYLCVQNVQTLSKNFKKYK